MMVALPGSERLPEDVKNQRVDEIAIGRRTRQERDLPWPASRTPSLRTRRDGVELPWLAGSHIEKALRQLFFSPRAASMSCGSAVGVPRCQS
jgi:hypothetical protein